MMTKERIIPTILSHKTKLAELGVIEIDLFGSYVRNENKPNSDIDLLVNFDEKMEICDNFIATCELLETLFRWSEESGKVLTDSFDGISQNGAGQLLKHS